MADVGRLSKPAAAASVSVSAAAGVNNAVALLLMVASGFAALGCQIVWTQQAGLRLGHEGAGVLAVVGAFFAGLALGAGWLGTRIERSARPVRWYALCEAVMGLWSLVLTVLSTLAVPWLLALAGAQPGPLRQWTVAFAGTFVLLLPATVAMGATLPAMERVLARWHGRGAAVAALYAGNTAGAVLGVLVAAFWFVPTWGLARTALFCGLLNLSCAVIAAYWDRQSVMVVPVSPAGSPANSEAGQRSSPVWLWLLAATGSLGIGYEVLVVRVLSQVTENTVYTFAVLLAMYLVGTALGAAAWHRWAPPTHEGHAGQAAPLLLQGLALACLWGWVILAFAQPIRLWAVAVLGSGMTPALVAEALLAALAFLPATCVMGALFSHLSRAALAQGWSLGTALAVNTLGAALGPPLFGVWLLPAIGAQAALVAVVLGYALLSLWRSPRAWVPPVLILAAAGAAVLFAPALGWVDVPEGGRLVSYRDGMAASVSVIEDAQGVSRLHINNRQQEGSSHTRFADARQAMLPLLLHSAPRRALFLGLGTGVTAASAAEDRQLQVDAVELLPEVIDASRLFTGPFAVDGRLRVLNADARRHVRTSSERYDLIVADNFHPARSGSGALYTVEHFRAIEDRLADGGLFCQWLPLHQLDLPTLRSIVRSFIEVHPQAVALLATHSLETPVLGLIARRGDGRFDAQAIGQRIRTAAWPSEPAKFGLPDELSVLGSLIAGPKALKRLAAGAPLNTDDHPVVSYLAPRITYAPDSSPGQRLVHGMRLFDLTPEEVLSSDAAGTHGARLAAYWRARNRFLEVGLGVQPSGDARRMLAQVREPLLSVLRVSPDFRPAYDPLLRLALGLVRDDRDAARLLLSELERVQPARPEAAQALRTLTAGPP